MDLRLARIRWLRILVWGGLLFALRFSPVIAAPPVSIATAAPADEFITIQRGELPIIISAPHGGRSAIPGVPERTNKDATRFVAVRDENTAEIAEALAADIEKRLGARPYLVIARFERKYIDVNRAAEHAYESPKAKMHYDAYHKTLAEFCREVQNKWRAGLLLDIHGQTTYLDSLLRGTNDGETVRRLIDRQGRGAYVGPKSIFGFLEKAGYDVMPKSASHDKEVPKYNGGFTVETYGSHQAGGIDAMQMEFGRKYRLPKSVVPQTAKDVGAAVEAFYGQYLKKPPSTK
jgi:N-formylglutamate amidohydrolase